MLENANFYRHLNFKSFLTKTKFLQKNNSKHKTSIKVKDFRKYIQKCCFFNNASFYLLVDVQGFKIHLRNLFKNKIYKTFKR